MYGRAGAAPRVLACSFVTVHYERMHDRCFAVVFTVTAGMALSALPVAAQTGPRTAWGDPALHGIWDFRSITPLQRPEEFTDQEFLTEEEAATLERERAEREEYLLNRPAIRTETGGNVDLAAEGDLPEGTFVNGSYGDHWLDRGTTTQSNRRSALIVDPPNGRIPPLTSEAEQRVEARNVYRREHPADSWEDRGLNDRCMFTTGLPMVPSAYNNNVHVFQTPDHLVMLIEMTHTLRVVPLDGRPHGTLPQFSGDSRGHWDGDTLVVETKNFNQLTSIRGSTPNALLVERFTRVSPDMIQYEFTVEDSETWASPWTAQVELMKTDGPLYEYACHEGNYSMAVILAGARAEEDEAAAQVAR